MKRISLTTAAALAAAATLALLAGPPAVGQAMLQPAGSECFRFGRTPDDVGGCWVRTPSGDAVNLKRGWLQQIEATPIPSQMAPSRQHRQPIGY